MNLKFGRLTTETMVCQLPTHVCHGVVALRAQGLKQVDIAAFYGITQGEVSKILKRNAETGRPTSRPRLGRPRKTTIRQDRLLIRLSTAGRTKPASTLRTEWQNDINVPVSVSLVKKRLVSAGYHSRRPLWKPKITIGHRHRRLEWARTHQRWTPAHWRHVVFSDEARFEVYRKDGRIRVRRRVEELYHECCIRLKVQAGGGGFTVWGAFHAGGKSELVVLDGYLNHRGYLQILREKMLPFARGHFAQNFVYQDDNAPAHRARAVATFFEEEEVEHLPWPACSPDMNPIENLWAEVTRRINKLDHQPSNVAEYRQAVMDAWAGIPVRTLESLVDSMPRRVRALRDARGGHTRY